MSEAYRRSVELYRMAKNTTGSNMQFNIDSERLSIHENYLHCLRLLASYARTHDDSVLALTIWGGRKRLGVKFQGKNVTVGVPKGGDIEMGVTHELKSPFELQKFLENSMQFTLANLNEELFEKAYEHLRKIESEKGIVIEPDEAKKW
jgi:hypothetical protein